MFSTSTHIDDSWENLVTTGAQLCCTKLAVLLLFQHFPLVARKMCTSYSPVPTIMLYRLHNETRKTIAPHQCLPCIVLARTPHGGSMNGNAAETLLDQRRHELWKETKAYGNQSKTTINRVQKRSLSAVLTASFCTHWWLLQFWLSQKVFLSPNS
eukprot:4872951-Amphidinium_carterae.1